MEQFVDRDLALNFPRLPYDMPPHPIADGGAYGDGLEDGALEELARWFACGDLLLNNVRDANQGSDVCCWPHHFDIATLISLDEDSGEDARSVGVGLSLGDENYAEPYIYVSPWPYPENSDLPELGAGHWHTDGFTAAILTSADIVAGADPDAFAADAVSACRALLK